MISLKELLAQIFDLDPTVRYAAAYSMDGQKISGGMRNGMNSLEPTEIASITDHETAKYAALLHSSGEYLGSLDHILIIMEKVKVLVAIIDPYVIQVAIDPQSPPSVGRSAIRLFHKARSHRVFHK